MDGGVFRCIRLFVGVVDRKAGQTAKKNPMLRTVPPPQVSVDPFTQNVLPPFTQNALPRFSPLQVYSMFLPKVNLARNAAWHDDNVTNDALGGKDSNVQDTQASGGRC